MHDKLFLWLKLYLNRKEMKRTIEEYKSRYDEYLSKIEKIDGFSRIREIQKQVEQAMKQ